VLLLLLLFLLLLLLLLLFHFFFFFFLKVFLFLHESKVDHVEMKVYIQCMSHTNLLGCAYDFYWRER
jgi:hypothetical protein